MIYKGFASVYDYLMQDTPYDAWYQLLITKLNEYDIKGKNILDLACGTGEMTSRLAKGGFKAMGVDISEEMLELAQQKSYESNLKVQYVNQDMTSLELFHTYDAVVSFCDGFNYITDYDQLEKTFRNVNNYLNQQGLFIFDMSSAYKLEHVLGQNVFTEISEEVAYVWENYYDQEKSLVEFDLTIFEKSNQLYKRTDEVHVQRAYTIDEITDLMAKTGFEFIEILDTNTATQITETTERWLFVGRKTHE